MARYERIALEPPTVIAYGVTIGDLFENAAYAMFEIGYEIDGVPPTYSHPIVAPGDSPSELLVNWLEELLFASRHQEMVWSSFTVDRLEEGGIQGSAGGMPADQVLARMRIVTGVVAPPEPVPVPEGWWVEVAFTTDRHLRST